jgi:hypothetical protein
MGSLDPDQLYAEGAKLAGILGAFGIEIGREVPDIWADRVRAGQPAFPVKSLIELQAWSSRILEQLTGPAAGE